MSRFMVDICRLLQVKDLRMSVCHRMVVPVMRSVHPIQGSTNKETHIRITPQSLSNNGFVCCFHPQTPAQRTHPVPHPDASALCGHPDNPVHQIPVHLPALTPNEHPPCTSTQSPEWSISVTCIRVCVQGGTYTLKHLFITAHCLLFHHESFIKSEH